MQSVQSVEKKLAIFGFYRVTPFLFGVQIMYI